MACLLALAAEAIRSTRAPAMPYALNSMIAASSRRRLVSCESQGMPRILQPTGWIDKELLGDGWHSGPAGRTGLRTR